MSTMLRQVPAIALITLVLVGTTSAVFKCLRCTSATDSRCAGGSLAAVGCLQDSNFCFWRIQDGHIERGCLTELPGNDRFPCTNPDDKTCHVCSDEGCNNDSWIKCHQCDKAEAPCRDAQSDASKATFCKKFEFENQCYAQVFGDSVSRGCTSDIAIPNSIPEGTISVCATDACNDRPRAELNPINCQQCAWDFKDCFEGKVTPSLCGMAGDSCYTCIDSGGHLLRGCRYDLDPAVKTCYFCDGNDNCNSINFPQDRLRCYQCKTFDPNNGCAAKLTGETFSSYCKVYKENDQCYYRRVNGTVERGCVSDLEPDVKVCDKLSSYNCQLCKTENCNSNSAVEVRAFGTALVMVALVIQMIHSLK